MENSFDFIHNKVVGITLEELGNTISEKYPDGTPVGGIFHYQLIGNLMSWLGQAGYEPEITDMFAANNKDKWRPGVTCDPAKAEQYGDYDPRAYMLRRVYCNILLRQHNDSHETSCCAVSYSQRGISVAFGVHVKYCRNLSLLGAERVFSNCSLGIKMQETSLQTKTDKCLEEINAYIMTEKNMHENILAEFQEMRDTFFSDRDMQILLEMLVRMRVCHDCRDSLIHQPEEYALNATQINAACERYFIEKAKKAKRLTYWDVLQIFNQDLKPERADFPTIIPQSAQLGKVFKTLLNNED